MQTFQERDDSVTEALRALSAAMDEESKRSPYFEVVNMPTRVRASARTCVSAYLYVCVCLSACPSVRAWVRA